MCVVKMLVFLNNFFSRCEKYIGKINWLRKIIAKVIVKFIRKKISSFGCFLDHRNDFPVREIVST